MVTETLRYRLVPIRYPGMDVRDVDSANADLRMFAAVDRRMTSRKMTRAEYVAYWRWLRLRRRDRVEHRRREVERARRDVELVMASAIAREMLRPLLAPFEEFGRACRAAVPVFERLNRQLQSYGSLGRRMAYELDRQRRLERHFELGGGQ